MKREIAVFLIITMVLSLSACGKTLKGTDGLIEKAREEIPISDSDTIDLQYAGMCGNDNRAIAWFISGNEYQKHYYLPMEVEVVSFNSFATAIVQELPPNCGIFSALVVSYTQT